MAKWEGQQYHKIARAREDFQYKPTHKYWDNIEKLWVDREVNAVINLKILGLDVFPSIKRRKGIPLVGELIVGDTSKGVLSIRRNT